LDGIRDGDCVTWAEGSATSNALIAETLAAVGHLSDLRLWFGILIGAQSLGQEGWRVGTYAGFHAARELLRRGAAQVHPVPYSRLGRFLTSGDWQVSVVVASGRREGGKLRLGPHLGAITACIASARLVVVRPTAALPEVAGTLIDCDRTVVELPVAASPLPEVKADEPDAAELAMAGHVAALVPDGATIELGIGRTVDAAAGGLARKARLGLHTGLMTDAARSLMGCGAITNSRKAFEPGRSVASGLLGSREFYDFAHANHQIVLHPAEMTHSARLLHEEPCFVSINSALEVDLAGQVNSEAIAGRYVGAVGGLPDFHQAAVSHRNGRAIIVLPSQAASGRSRIVARLNGPATLPASVADFVVTEHGIAALRDRSAEERRAALIAVADPAHRRELAA
jgi:acyl CoA:acetate/3-ketoacid CoA transferase beta subunit